MGKKYLLEQIGVGMLDTNCYLLADAATRDALIIDPGSDEATIIRRLDVLGWKPVAIVNTHGHADHIGANRALKEHYDLPLYIHRDEASFLTEPRKNASILTGNPLISPPADVLLKDGDSLAVGKLTVKVMSTPGHTPGGICLLVEDLIFSGDTLFDGDVGRWDLPGGDEDELRKSLARISALPAEMIVLPGHGSSTTIAREQAANPYLKP